MNIGKLRNKIDIVYKGVKKDDEGYKVKGPSDILFKTVWANVNNLYGKEFWSAKTVNAESTVIFVIRYSKDLEKLDGKKHQIKFGKRCFDIVHIDNIQYRNKELKIKAIEVI